MADDKKVTIKIQTEYDGKGVTASKKGLKEVEKQAEKTNENMEDKSKIKK